MDYKILLLIGMLFFHIVDDYYLQGFLASAKQKSWWEKNYPSPLYKYDYIMALIEHAFSWTVMVHIPIIIYVSFLNIQVNHTAFLCWFIVNLLLHTVVDHAKANLLEINLIQDQLLHIAQIVFTWVLYANI